MIKKILNYFTAAEKILWCCSVAVLVASFIIFHQSDYLTLSASLIGVTALIFIAKGNPIGQVLMIVFASIYGIVSWSFAYYGEMMTYLGMSLPMAIFSLLSWLKNPFLGKRSEVKIDRLGKKDVLLMLIYTVIVTAMSFYLLRSFGTANLIPSTVSVSTSFSAAYLTFRRSPYFSLVYAVNDIVLIFLWTLAAIEDISYLSVIVCFAAFFANDLYSFISWKKREKSQSENENAK